MNPSTISFRFLGRFIVLARISISLIAALGVSTSFADPLGLATSFVTVGGDIGGGGGNFGPLPQSLSAAYDGSVSGNLGGIPQYAHEVSSVQATIGPGIPLVGNVDANAVAIASGPYTSAITGAGGYVIFYFEVTQIQVPTMEPMTLPVYYEAMGEGSVLDGYGTYQVIATLVEGSDVISNDRIQHEGYASTDSFDRAITVNLAPGVVNTVSISANASASAHEGLSYSWAVAAVDPIIRFDQATFDAMYGSNSFPLADYYQINFSPNVPVSSSVPEPATLALLGLGLAGLGFSRRRKVT